MIFIYFEINKILILFKLIFMFYIILIIFANLSKIYMFNLCLSLSLSYSITGFFQRDCCHGTAIRYVSRDLSLFFL